MHNHLAAKGLRANDVAVLAAYGMKGGENTLAFLLKLNLELAEAEARGKRIVPPGLPASVSNPKDFVTGDCIAVGA